ncbi:MAG: S8 family serine peptidase [Candidatus Sericytochromatia bacterium]|nr:S8 family serine peptidase [Candidatus Sericytochromatia bacterium]
MGAASNSEAGAVREAVVFWQPTATSQQRQALRTALPPAQSVPLTPHAELWLAPPGTFQQVRQSSLVRGVEPNQRRSLLPPPASPGLAFRLQASPPLSQWHLSRARFPQAWAASRGKGVTVAVIDSGVDPNHPDLKANLLPLIDEVTAMGRKDVIDGKNFDGMDSHGHGTHVSGLIAAVTRPDGSISGGAPESKILPVKVTPLSGETDDATIAKGIRDAVDQGARVLNLSIGGPEPSPILLEALNYAILKGALPVIAAGNDGGRVNFPAAYPGVVAVGSITDSGKVADYSCRGEGLVIVAPGGGQTGGREGSPLLSTMPTYPAFGSSSARAGNGTGTLAGTSMAAPLVSAAAALVMARFPELSAPQVRTRLAATANEGQAQRWEANTGFGALNAEAAVTERTDQ